MILIFIFIFILWGGGVARGMYVCRVKPEAVGFPPEKGQGARGSWSVGLIRPKVCGQGFYQV